MSIIKGVKVGTTNVTGTYVDNLSESDSQTINVTAVSLKSISTPENTTYTGNEICPTPIVKADVNGVDTTLILDTDYSLSYKNNINAGTATVIATGIGNFSGTVESTWTINSADITIEAPNQTYAYDCAEKGNEITAYCISQEPTIKYGLTEGIYNLNSAPKFKNVSSDGFYIVYYQVTASNHNTATGYYTLTITPKTTSLTWGTSSWTYDGDEHSTTCTVANLIGNDTCTVTLSNNSITNIGSTTVTATGLSNSNYELPSSGLTQTITINPGLFIKVSGTWTPVKKVYKKVSGTWVLQELSGSFNTNKLYMEK